MKHQVLHTITAGIALTLLSGCQFLAMSPDQLGTQLAESLIESSTGEKVNIEGLESGKISIETTQGKVDINTADSNGEVKITDKTTGETVQLTGNDQQAKLVTKDGEVFSSDADKKPANSPADLPVLDNGKDFVFFNTPTNESLSYTLKAEASESICQKQIGLLTEKGWSKSAEANFGNLLNVSFSNAKGDKLEFQCTSDNPVYLNFVVTRKLK